MRKNVRNTENGVIFIFTDFYIYNASVSFADNPMNCQRQSYPLIFFYATVVVRIQVSRKISFIQRILLYVQSWRVNVRTKDYKPVFQIFTSNLKKGNAFVHFLNINLVASLYFFNSIKIFIAIFFCSLYNFSDTFALCFSFVQKILISSNKFLFFH